MSENISDRATIRNLSRAMDEADRLTEKLDLSRDVRALGTEYYREVRGKGKLPGRSVEEVMSAALYIGCKKKNLPRNPDDFAKHSKYDRKQILRTSKYLEQVLEINIEPTEPTKYVSHLADELNLSGETETKAMEILDIVVDHGAHAGKSPTAVAAGTVYAASTLTGEKVTQAEVGNITNLTHVTIRDRYTEQLEIYQSET